MVDKYAYWWNVFHVGEQEVDVDKMHHDEEMDTLHLDDLNVSNREICGQHQKNLR